MRYTFDFENVQFDIQVKRKAIFIDLVEEDVAPKQNISFSDPEISNKVFANSNAVWYFANPNGNSNISNPNSSFENSNTGFGSSNAGYLDLKPSFTGFGNFGNSNSTFENGNAEIRPFNNMNLDKPLVEKFQEPFVFDGPEIVDDEIFHYEADLPFITNRFTFVGQYGIYRGYIHHWVRRNHLNKRSSYRRNSVNH